MSRQLIARTLKRSRGEFFRALPKCIRCVHEGQIWPSNTELEFLLEVITKPNSILIHKAGGMAILTRREQDVVRHVAGGKRNPGISRKVNLREQTVPTGVFRIFQKIGHLQQGRVGSVRAQRARVSPGTREIESRSKPHLIRQSF